jgi:predicted ATPase/transcriptional regulator with XRE-family HTH domain
LASQKGQSGTYNMTVDTITSFGEWLRRRRRALDLSQDELAAQVGLSSSAIRKIESDERRPSREAAHLLAEALAIPVEMREQFIKVARGELRTERLGEAIRPPAPVAHIAPPPPTPSPAPNPVGASRIPIPLSPLHGRQVESAEIEQLMRNPECRLLTIIGMGGVGKTRLALQVATGLQDAFADGVVFVPLAAVSTPSFLPAAIASALGLSFGGDTNLQSELFRHLQNKAMLLVLDNLEQLLAPETANAAMHDGVEMLTTLLTQAPYLKLLTTSREPLALYGEWLFELRGLPTPESATEPVLFSAAQAERNSAVGLFVQAARQVQHGFTLNAGNWPAIVRICQLVDGLPLGIELAAAWVRTLSCAEIADEIARTVDFLSSARRDQSGRHQSLRAVFAYSWRLLTSDEQRTISRLSVFHGSFARQAAQPVADATLPRLSALVTKSLLRRSDGGRYELHPLIQQFAAEQLTMLGETDATAQRHLAYYVTLAATAEPYLTSADQVDWVNRLAEEHNNLRGALRWAVDHHQREAALRMSSALRVFWEVRGYIAEGRSWLAQALELPDPAPIALQAKASLTAGQLALEQHDLPTAQRQLENSLSLHREMGEAAEIAATLSSLGRAAWLQGDNIRARTLYEEALTLHRTQNNRQGIARVLNGLGLVAMSLRELDAAAQYLAEGIALDQGLGNHREVARALFNLGMVHVRMAEGAERAKAYFEASIASSRKVGYVRFEAYALNNLAMLALHRGDASQARMLAQESLRLCQVVEDKLGAGYALINVAHSAIDQGEFTQAADFLRQCVAILHTVVNDEIWLWLSELCARLAGAQGQTSVAIRLASAASALRVASGLPLPPTAQRYFDQFLTTLRSQVDAATHADAELRGAAMTVEQTRQLVLSHQ